MLIIDCVFEKNTMLRERNDGRFTVAWDMDNTLVDDFGRAARPGVEACLRRMLDRGIKLVVWTNSGGDRALDILRARGLDRFFYALVARESYDLADIASRRPGFHRRIVGAFPRESEFQNKFNGGKNLTLLGYDALIDDDPEIISQARFWNNAYRVEVCERYTGRGGPASHGGIDLITDRIIKIARPSLAGRILSALR